MAGSSESCVRAVFIVALAWRCDATPPNKHPPTIAPAGGLVATLLVFRNNLSHARYNEARMLIGQAKNALRTMYQQAHTCLPDLVVAVKRNPDDVQLLECQKKSVELMKLSEVRGRVLVGVCVVFVENQDCLPRIDNACPFRSYLLWLWTTYVARSTRESSMPR